MSGGAPLCIMCCVYSQEKMCPVHLYYRVYLVDRTFLVQKYIFSCLPGTIRHSLALKSKEKSAIWLVNRNHKISKCIAEFHLEERATHVVMKMSSRYHRLLIYDVK